jgi:hypothetical protein
MVNVDLRQVSHVGLGEVEMRSVVGDVGYRTDRDRDLPLAPEVTVI